jgi:hypothetical protein
MPANAQGTAGYTDTNTDTYTIIPKGQDKTWLSTPVASQKQWVPKGSQASLNRGTVMQRREQHLSQTNKICLLNSHLVRQVNIHGNRQANRPNRTPCHVARPGSPGLANLQTARTRLFARRQFDSSFFSQLQLFCPAALGKSTLLGGRCGALVCGDDATPHRSGMFGGRRI